MLTRKQKELLLLIRDRLAADGVPPSFDEMKEALGLKSKSGIHRLITGLEERGFIKRLAHRARALEILRLPEGMDNKSAKSPRKKATSLPAELPDMAAIAAVNSISLPMYGRIAAGTPIEALRDSHAQIDVPAAMLMGSKGKRGADEHYALEVSGDSMINAGIMDGDQVIILKTNSAENGAIVVALVEGYEATLKYMEKRKEGIALIPANDRYETRIFPAGKVEVQGKLVGLVRKYYKYQ